MAWQHSAAVGEVAGVEAEAVEAAEVVAAAVVFVAGVAAASVVVVVVGDVVDAGAGVVVAVAGLPVELLVVPAFSALIASAGGSCPVDSSEIPAYRRASCSYSAQSFEACRRRRRASSGRNRLRGTVGHIRALHLHLC